MRRKILLVDDSNTVLMMERMMLSQMDFDIEIAKNGREAVERARARTPDIILMDVVMPEMNGFEAVREIRANQATKATPIIMVTTRGEEISLQEGYDAGCTDYVTKPFDSYDLLQTVKKHLEGEDE